MANTTKVTLLDLQEVTAFRPEPAMLWVDDFPRFVSANVMEHFHMTSEVVVGLMYGYIALGNQFERAQRAHDYSDDDLLKLQEAFGFYEDETSSSLVWTTYAYDKPISIVNNGKMVAIIFADEDVTLG